MEHRYPNASCWDPLKGQVKTSTKATETTLNFHRKATTSINSLHTKFSFVRWQKTQPWAARWQRSEVMLVWLAKTSRPSPKLFLHLPYLNSVKILALFNPKKQPRRKVWASCFQTGHHQSDIYTCPLLMTCANWSCARTNSSLLGTWELFCRPCWSPGCYFQNSTTWLKNQNLPTEEKCTLL